MDRVNGSREEGGREWKREGGSGERQGMKMGRDEVTRELGREWESGKGMGEPEMKGGKEWSGEGRRENEGWERREWGEARDEGW